PKPAVKPAPPPPARARTFRSTLPFTVFQVVEGEPPRVLGWTGMAGMNTKAINIPAGALWYVQPKPGFGALGNIGRGFGFVGGAPPGGKGLVGGRPPKGKPAFTFDSKLTGDKLKTLIAEMKKQSIPGLALNYMQISDEDLGEFSKVPQLQTLLLTGNKVSDDGLDKLKDFRSLRFLALESTEVTDKGLEKLKNIKTLTRLHLAGPKITNKGMEA